ncbi:hypothetical protein [Salinimicrobium sp. GXAS 041]|uniref:hypothetical protein n=1 Tax=Salinimicrobium sp. GXAS 041 TaxID=3400806 RepID=UPI003C71308F
MKKNISLNTTVLALCLTTSLFLTSCKDKSENAATEPTPTAAETMMENNGEAQTAQVNPAHGLPGHRCDLPVGAPLNSAAKVQETPAPAQSTTISPIRVDQTPKVNPPHGEPGHDCAVPVGAALKQS